MPKNTAIIPDAPVARIMKDAGAPRVSKKAAHEMSVYAYVYATAIAKKAVELSRHCGRTTILANDVRFSIQK